ncbi:SH3 domain-containing protein [Lactiplantibacillus plantarum]|uniref:SH3 domain-containing protein n=1 Tax=Lactiplantibacillus plantarum TaxID=1590 RepID=UPI0019110CAF|nr:SH3 domain-containing protein [Lactiplantibacillus plantarum]
MVTISYSTIHFWSTSIRTVPSLSAPVVGTYYPGDSVTYTRKWLGKIHIISSRS